MTYPFRYDEQAAIEAILYVSRRVSDRTLMRICKILYLADKLHLERYGRFIFGDTYYALEHGPVPSKAYREMQDVRDGRNPEAPFRVEGVRYVVPLRDADFEEFSESDLECLNEAIASYGEWPIGRLRDISHDNAYDATEENRAIELLDIINTLPNSEAVIDYLELDCEVPG